MSLPRVRAEVGLIEHQPVDRPLVADQEQLAVSVDAERGDLLRRLANLSHLDQLATGLLQCPDSPRLEIAEEIGAVIRRISPSPINVAPGHRRTIFPAIGHHGRRIRLTLPAVLVRELHEAFVDIPAVVFAGSGDRDLLEQILADVADPQVARARVEAEAPRHAKTRCPDFRTDRSGRVSIRVRLGDRVGLAALLPVDIDPQDGSGQLAQVLAVTVGVLLRAGIPRADIQEPVGAERQHPTPVQVGVLVDLQQPPGRTARVAPEIGGRLPLDNHRREETALVADVIVHVVLPVFEEARMEREADHTLEFTGRRFLTQVREQLLLVLACAFLEAPDLPRLLFDDEERALAAGHGDHPNRMVEPHLLFMQRHQPDGLFDRRNLARHARRSGLALRLFQRLKISDQVGELLGRQRLVLPGGHQ